MGYMKNLNTEGVTDLYSYSVGYEDAIDNVIAIVREKITPKETAELIIDAILEEK